MARDDVSLAGSFHRKRISIYTYSFLCVGSLLALPGASLGVLTRHCGKKTEARLWPVFFVRGIAYTVSSYLGGIAGDRYGHYKNGGHMLMALAMLGAGFGIYCAWYARSVPELAIASCLASVAMGILDTVGNVSTLRSSEAAGLSSTRDLSIVHSAFGIGCLLAPALVAYLGLELVFLIVTISAIISSLALFLGPGIKLIPLNTNSTSQINHQDERDTCLAKAVALLLFLLYVGAEQGAGALLATVAQVSLNFSRWTSLFSVAIFWMAIFLGRVAVALFPPVDHTASIVSIQADYFYILGSLLLSGIASLLLSTASTYSAVYFVVCVFFLGFGFGPIFPIAFARLEVRLGTINATYGGILIAAGGLGEMIVPPTLFQAWHTFHERGHGEIGFAIALASFVALDALAWLSILFLTAPKSQSSSSSPSKTTLPMYERVPTVSEVELQTFADLSSQIDCLPTDGN